jgi:two-component system OmpR family sensor kinase
MTRASLARRLPLVMAGVVAIAVGLAALVAWPLISNAAENTARAALARTADLTAELLQRTLAGDPAFGRAGVAERLDDLLSPQEVAAVIVTPTTQVRAPLLTADVVAVTTGQEVNAVRRGPSGTVYVEGRPVTNGLGVLLVQPATVAQDLSSQALARFFLALLLGLAVAALVGYVVARRLTRPLARAAAAAAALSSGQREVRVDPEGPAEVAELAEALNRLAASLEDSEGRQREFFLTVSHELRTPLTAIKGYAEALSDGMVEPGEVPAVASVVRTEADRLDRLVADLLDLARLGAVDVRITPVEVDLAMLGTDALRVWADRTAREGVVLVDEVDRTPRMVFTDPVRARQIMDNLLENALRVTDEGAPVVLHVGPAPWPGEFVLEVRDGGPGLTADDLAVAFEPGELHSRYTGIRSVGSGVGLALVARLAERLGGRAEAGVSREGGAAFRVILPDRSDGSA